MPICVSLLTVISCALQRMNMDHHRMIDIAHFLESCDQRGNIVAGLHIPIIQAKRVEQIRLGGATGRAQTGERTVHATEIAGNRHLIVVEHNDEIAALFSPSNATPELSEPSPITAITLPMPLFGPSISRVFAKPQANEIEVPV